MHRLPALGFQFGNELHTMCCLHIMCVVVHVHCLDATLPMQSSGMLAAARMLMGTVFCEQHMWYRKPPQTLALLFASQLQLQRPFCVICNSTFAQQVA